MSKPLARITAGIALASLGTPATGCGFCDEDKVAAVYDHASIGKAFERHRHVAFFAIEGAMPDAAKARRAVLKSIASANGVDAASVRISFEPASLGFAYDPKRTAPRAIAAALNRELAPSGLTASLLKIMETP